ncbi:unnamed protein product [Penicillium salamii]|nr:unnamed protein product [Penicillium salamii]
MALGEKSSSAETTPTASTRHIKTKSAEVDLENGISEPDTRDQDEASRDPNIVDWDGPDDPENPSTGHRKRSSAPQCLLH